MGQWLLITTRNWWDNDLITTRKVWRIGQGQNIEQSEAAIMCLLYFKVTNEVFNVLGALSPSMIHGKAFHIIIWQPHIEWAHLCATCGCTRLIYGSDPILHRALYYSMHFLKTKYVHFDFHGKKPEIKRVTPICAELLKHSYR